MTLNVQEHISLQRLNTFGIAAQARWFAEIHNDAQALEAIELAQSRGLALRILGGGSNVLLTGNIERALVVQVKSQGMRLQQEAGASVILEAEAGALWHEVVGFALQNNLSGLENLSLIPGTVGAAPIQNIGAYGVELQDVFAGLTAIDSQTGLIQDFSPADCQFGYRDSRFKHEPGRWLVLRVRLQLWREPRLHLDYGQIQQRLEQLGIQTPTPAQVSQVVCSIRREKLPDPSVLGNAGSFFKNPVVSASQASVLKERFADLVAYPQADGQVKLAAGWLIDKAGWKGFREGDAGVHRWQALVLVNYGQASGAEILALAQRIQQDILERFGVALEMEPVLF